MAIDKAMLEDEAYNSGSDPESSSSGASSPGSAGFVENSDPLTSTDRQITRKSLLGPRITSVLNLVSAPCALYARSGTNPNVLMTCVSLRL